jgi:hypothetical protein
MTPTDPAGTSDPTAQVAALLHDHEVTPWDDVDTVAARIMAALTPPDDGPDESLLMLADDLDRVTRERDEARAEAAKHLADTRYAIEQRRLIEDLHFRLREGVHEVLREVITAQGQVAECVDRPGRVGYQHRAYGLLTRVCDRLRDLDRGLLDGADSPASTGHDPYDCPQWRTTARCLIDCDHTPSPPSATLPAETSNPGVTQPSETQEPSRALHDYAAAPANWTRRASEIFSDFQGRGGYRCGRCGEVCYGFDGERQASGGLAQHIVLRHPDATPGESHIEGLPHAEAVAALQRFIAEANAALDSLRERRGTAE